MYEQTNFIGGSFMKAQFTIDEESPEKVQVEFIDSSGNVAVRKRKSILYDHFVSILQGCTTMKEEMLHVGQLPIGYLDGVIGLESFICAVTVEGGIKPLQYYNDNYMIPFPKLLFIAKCSKGILKSSAVYAIKDEKVTGDSKLFHYPYGNVYDKGAICWGSNTIHDVFHLKDMERIISLFFGSSTNDDLWKVGVNVIVKDNSQILQRGLLEYLKGQEQFPEEMLVTYGLTVHDVLVQNKII